MLRIDYIIFINNNVAINNLWKTPRSYFALQISQWARERIFSKYIENLGKVPTEIFASPGLCCSDRVSLNTGLYTHPPKL